MSIPETWDEGILNQRFPHLDHYEMEIVSLLYVHALWRHRCINVVTNRSMRRGVLTSLHARLRERFYMYQPDTPIAVARVCAQVTADVAAICDAVILSKRETQDLEVRSDLLPFRRI